MDAPPVSIVMFAVAAALGALGQYLYKTGAQHASGTLASFVSSPRILAGVVCYVAVMVLFVAGFRRGGALTVLYPVYASTFIWAALIARWTDDVTIRPIHVAGMAALVLGMYLMGK
jgi:hypothetical protein